jgi:FtsP/CotA-like multicopper oxidase with cupredoxin domain
MKYWLALSSLGLLLCVGSYAVVAPGAATAGAVISAGCGPVITTHTVVEPPSLSMRAMPVDDRGDHELILAVHEVNDRFCYHYRSGGAWHIGAPAIHVQPGERFAIRVVNDIRSQSSGERVAASKLAPCRPVMTMASMFTPVHRYVGYLNHTLDDRMMNASDNDTNIHFHGFEGPAEQDDPFLSTLSTPMHACEYVLTVPKTQTPGTYLYHPHAHGASDDQVAGGLVGAWIVDPPSPELPAAQRHLLVLGYAYPFSNEYAYPSNADHVFLAGAAHVAALRAARPVAYDPFAPPDWPSSVPMKAKGESFNSDGCDGYFSDSTVAIDGRPVPATMRVAGDRTQALEILNATSDSPKRLSLVDAAGKSVPMEVAEIDGHPVGANAAAPLSTVMTLHSLLIPPAGRATVLVDVPTGATLVMRENHFCAGVIEAYEPTETLLTIRGTAGAAPAERFAAQSLPAGASPADALVAWVATHRAQVHRRAITFSNVMIPKDGKVPAHPSFFITDTTNPNFHEHVFDPRYAADGAIENPDVTVTRGTVEEWYLFNTSLGHHSFHIHQMTFVVENSAEGRPVTVDTVWLPPGTARANPADPNYPLVHPSVTKVILDFRHVPRGTFVFHCHMLYHEDRGMMATIRVV